MTTTPTPAPGTPHSAPAHSAPAHSAPARSATPGSAPARPGAAVLDFDDPGFQADPWALYDHHREHDPVHRSELLGGYAVFGYELVREVLVSPRFSAYHPFRTSRRAFGPSMLDRDGAEHQRLRSAAAGPFRPRAVAGYAERIVAPLAGELLDELVAERRTDLVDALARTLPFRVMCRVLGLPVEEAPWLAATLAPLVDYVDHGPTTLAEVTRRREELRERLQRARAGEARDGLLADLAADERLSPAEVVNTAVLLLAAGTETTAAGIANVLVALGTRPELYRRLRTRREEVPGVVAETLRHEPPLHVTLRFAAEDVDLEGVRIPAGAPVNAFLAAANRDPAVFPGPDVWDPQRRPQRTPLTFGAGRHVCLGAGLAVAELETVVNAVLDRVEALDVLAPAPLPSGRTFRAASPVRCAVRPAAGAGR
ncbi:cytochrome P450 [Kitasatospora indigofera]|uniref:cytochrome P450 n=1 Tax=Kitasatospora indigofera TaxID=67307 RepID=UPI0036393BEC